MTDVGYVGGGYNDEVGQARSICLSHVSYFIKYMIIPPPKPRSGPSAIGGGSRTPATSLGGGSSNSGAASGKVSLVIRRKMICQCITRNSDQVGTGSYPEEDFVPNNNLDTFSRRGFQADNIDKECDERGSREIRVNISQVVGLCKRDAEGQRHLLGYPCKCALDHTCYVETDIKGFLTDPQLADGAPTDGPVYDDVGKAKELLSSCPNCEAMILAEAEEVWVNNLGNSECTECLVEKGMGCDQNDTQVIRMVLNSSKLKDYIMTDLEPRSLCIKEDCPGYADGENVRSLCDRTREFFGSK
tara:strand:+ start:1756 stop:2658 length:903 start_codon:yes stop_codon:yes gene_type:complete